MFNELDTVTKEIYCKYKPALKYIGVDFSREDVQEAINYCYVGIESAFQAVISYWIWQQQSNKKIDYPNALFIEALSDRWKPYNWKDEYLNDSRFKSSCLIWWEEAGKRWGTDLRNKLIADVNETDTGEEYILLTSGEKMSLNITKIRGWDWALNYAQEKQALEYNRSIQH